MASRTVYRCRQDMATVVNGQRTHFAEGDLVFEDHGVKPKANPHFEEISLYVERTSVPYRRGVRVEDATAEPDHKRSLTRPASRKKSAEKPAEAPSEDEAPKAQEEVPDGKE